jgi:hypothetical protein
MYTGCNSETFKLGLMTHIRRKFSIFFIGFLVLFLNFGPSYHHVNFFSGPESAEQLDTLTCSCCFPTTDPTSEGTFSPDEECQICEFFKNYHAKIDHHSTVIATDAHVFAFGVHHREPRLFSLTAHARGPPSETHI